ncbi:MAG: helix-hairpin-helix domain-containing protein, partial [Flavihumibacter sp.]
PPADSTQLRQLIAALPPEPGQRSGVAEARKEAGFAVTGKGALFFFDPNTIAAEEWVRLGLNTPLAERIRHYVEKGGRFRKPADIRKIYGMAPEMADRLAPYVRLPETDRVKQAGFPNDRKPARRQQPAVQINLADSTDWEALPGIGAVLAGRIVRFREKLGGFYAATQLLEVFGLRDSTYRLIEPLLRTDQLHWKRIPLNQATEATLAAHPYIRWKLAKIIVAYRTAHGPFLQVDELKDIHLVTPLVFEKIAPYCQLEEDP